MADKEAMLTKEQKADNKLLNEAIMYANACIKKVYAKEPICLISCIRWRLCTSWS